MYLYIFRCSSRIFTPKSVFRQCGIEKYKELGNTGFCSVCGNFGSSSSYQTLSKKACECDTMHLLIEYVN